MYLTITCIKIIYEYEYEYKNTINKNEQFNFALFLSKASVLELMRLSQLLNLLRN